MGEINTVEDYEGFHGWLLLVGFITITTPIGMTVGLWHDFLVIYKSWLIDLKELEDFVLVLIVYWEYFFGVGLWLLSLFLVFLFFKKKNLFPKLSIWLQVAFYLFGVWPIFGEWLWSSSGMIWDQDLIFSLFLISAFSIVWIAYMLVSKRVKATFVN